MVGGFVVYIRGNALNEAHIPIGLLSGIEYAFMMAAGIGIVILGVLLLVSGGFGHLARVLTDRQNKNLG